MRSRPDFIPAEKFREYMTMCELDKLFRVDGIRVSTFLSRCERDGRPVRSVVGENKAGKDSKKFRPIDVWARAMAESLDVTPHEIVELKEKITSLNEEKDRLSAEVVELYAKIEQTNHVVETQRFAKEILGRRLLTEAEIVSGAEKWNRDACGIYFLCSGGRVVYVGQSVHIMARIGAHVAEGKKDFNAVAWVRCAPGKLNLLETMYIHLLRPRLNGNCGPMSWDEIVGSAWRS